MKKRTIGKSTRVHGFIIRKLEGRLQPFLVDVRKHGFTRQRTFLTQSAAAAYCAELRAELDGSGLRAFDLSDTQRLEARRALDALNGRCSLEEAARFWCKYHPDQSLVTFAETIKRYRDHMTAQQMRPATMRGLWRLERVARELGSMAIMAVTTEELNAWLDRQGFSASNRNNFRRRLSALFNFATQEGLIDRNPVARIPIVRTESQPIIFWPADQVAMLLEKVGSLYPPLLPMLTIMAFAGLRPAEAEALRWESINLEERTIRVEGATSKNRARRVVTIPENLALWLVPHRRSIGPVAPKPQSIRRWRERIAAALIIPDAEERLRRATGQKGTAIKNQGLSWAAIIAEARKHTPKLWPPDVLRHSYASHWLPAYKNEHDLAQQMGNSPSVIHRHYRGLVTESEAKRYWAISPKQSC